MSRTRPAPALRWGWSRCQVVPLADRKIRGVLPADPVAMKPVAVRLTTLIWSPGRRGSPAVEDRVQVRPSGLVQIDEGPRATQAPGPPATNRAAYPGGGGPPSGVRTRPIDQVRPSSVDTKNWARAIRAPCCEPTATISAPSLATWPSVWLMPRPVAAALNAFPARVAGGKPSAAGGGAGPLGLLFAPAMTATATPNTIMATIGMTTRTPAPRKCSAERNSANQFRLTGSGRNERSSRTHSVPAPRGAGRGWPGRRWPGRGWPGRGWRGSAVGALASNSKPGAGWPSQAGRSFQALGAAIGWLMVGVYRKRRASASGAGAS